MSVEVLDGPAGSVQMKQIIKIEVENGLVTLDHNFASARYQLQFWPPFMSHQLFWGG